MLENQENKKISNDDEIDLIELFQKVWAERKTIFISIGIFFVLGVFYIILSPKDYKSETTLLVESSSKSSAMSGMLSQLGGLAGLAGINASSGEGGITPSLYPDIVKSTPFLVEVATQKIKYKNDSLQVADFQYKNYNLSFSEKLKKVTIGLPSTLISLLTAEDTFFKPKYVGELHPRVSNACVRLSKRIKVKEGEASGILNVSVEMQDPLVAAQLTEMVVKSITKYVIVYRTQKTIIDLEFIENQYFEAKSKYLKAQQELAHYQDQNKNVILSSTRTEEDRLKSEFALKQGIYNNFAQQLEQKKIEIQENTPVFTTIEPVKPNFSAVKPNIPIILIAMIFLGGVLGFFILIIKMILKKIVQ